MMKKLSLLLLLSLLLTASISNVFGQQGFDEWCATLPEHVMQGFKNGTCFRYITDEELSRDDAQLICATTAPADTGDLAQIPSQFAQTTLYRNLLRYMRPTPRNLWIGARGYTSPEWRWADGRPLEALIFSNWALGNPPAEPPINTKYCAYVDITDPGLQWRVENCGVQKQFICEYKLPTRRRNGYQFVPAHYKLDWYAAKVECQREGGQLMDMTTVDQLNNWRTLIIQMIQSSGSVSQLPAKGSVWIGLNRQIWLWDEADKEIGWSNFSSASLQMEPVQDCVYMSVDLEWIPTTCSAKLNYLCQYERTTLITTETPARTTMVPITTLLPTTLTAGPVIVKSSTTISPPQASTATGTEPYIIAIIVICIICFIVIVIAIVLACCGHIWLPRVRRRIGTPGDTYVAASPSPTVTLTKTSPVHVDVAVTAHPVYANQSTTMTINGYSTNNSSNNSNGDAISSNLSSLMKVPTLQGTTNPDFYGEDDSEVLSMPQSGGACFSADEPPNDIPEIYTSPTYLYSFPSHRALEAVAPRHVDDVSTSGSSNLSRSPSSTTSPPMPLLPPQKVMIVANKPPAPLPPPKVTLHTFQNPPTPPPPFRPLPPITSSSTTNKNNKSSSQGTRNSDEIVDL